MNIVLWKVHLFRKDDARTFAIQTIKGNVSNQKRSFYGEISEEDTIMDLISGESVEAQPEKSNDTDDYADKSDGERFRPSRVFRETCLERKESVNRKDKCVHDEITNLQ